MFLIAIIPLGVSLTYSEDGFAFSASISHIKILPKQNKLPGEEKPKKEKKKREKKPKKNKPESEKAEKPKKGGTVTLIKKLIPVVLDTLKRFRHKLTVNELTVIYTADSDDPFDNVMKYGRIWAAIGAVIPLLENNFRIKKRNIEALIAFDGEGDTVYVDAKLSIRVWEIIYIVCGMLPAVKILVDWKRGTDGKDVENGQATGK